MAIPAGPFRLRYLPWMVGLARGLVGSLGLGLGLGLAACTPLHTGAAAEIPPPFSAAPLSLTDSPWAAPDGLEAAVILSATEPRFGGWSGLALVGEELVAVSDRGYWFRARWSPDSNDGALRMTDPRLGMLAGLDGQPLRLGRERDAESVTRLPDGSLLVAFERDHRLWRYPGAEPPFSLPPQPVTAPPGLDAAGFNEGIEATAVLPDGRQIVFLEGPDGAERATGWIGTPDADAPTRITWQPLGLRLSGSFRPTGAAVATNGDLLVLERFFAIPMGFATRLRRIAATDIQAGVDLDGPTVLHLNVPPVNDNFEGIATQAMADGSTRVFLISDDNYSGLQRTILLILRL